MRGWFATTVFCAACSFQHGAAAKLDGSPSGGDASDARPDGRVDAPHYASPDVMQTGTCYGTSPFQVCLPSPPSGTFHPGSNTEINTDASPMCATLTAPAPSVCVIAAASITIDHQLGAYGSKPLVLLSTSTITISNVIDVGSHRNSTPQLVGAGGDSPACAAGTAPTGGGGGQAGSFGTVGGNGGDQSGAGNTHGIAGVTMPNPTTLRGGCPGAVGGGTTGNAGHGGGALQLIATSSIMMSGTLDASGSGGDGADTGNGGMHGGCGGGSGGMIILDSPSVVVSGNVYANGGGGGGGGGTIVGGTAGGDPTAPTNGGSGGPAGGSGGAGAVGAHQTTVGGFGANGSSSGDGGGAGGGGHGVIKVLPAQTLGGTVSPAPS